MYSYIHTFILRNLLSVKNRDTHSHLSSPADGASETGWNIAQNLLQFDFVNLLR